MIRSTTDVGVAGEVVLAAAQHPVRGHLVERAEEHLGGGVGADVVAERAAAWPVGDGRGG